MKFGLEIAGATIISAFVASGCFSAGESSSSQTKQPDYSKQVSRAYSHGFIISAEKPFGDDYNGLIGPLKHLEERGCVILPNMTPIIFDGGSGTSRARTMLVHTQDYCASEIK